MPDSGPVLALISLLALLALPAPASSATQDSSAGDAAPLRLLMVLWRGETAAEAGFLDTLHAHQISLEIERIDAGQDRENLAHHFWRLGNGVLSYDAVYSFGTTASVMTHSLVRGRIPQFYSMVSDPQEAGLMQRTGPAPITGTTDAIAAELKIRTARQLFPIRHIAMLFNARERNARVQLDEMEQLCEQLGITLSVLRVAPESRSLANQLQRLRAGGLGIDTVYLPSDSYLISQSATIMAALEDTDYRVVGATETFVADGALLAIAPDYRHMGERLGERLVTLLHSGEQALDTTPISVDQPLILYNEATRQRLGIEIPEQLRGQLSAVGGPAGQ
ncbi:ABC transporter substrate-binding protein [Motiliproteus sediminis]|uniref:ABC transporter substrate-binding protein n=1 Tax=Motiliproteus sediminis TaxID=1468178 RepID=UPI001AEFF957|nr:ABC transporter substrate binding protein [Motiliproteus sediminis]